MGMLPPEVEEMQNRINKLTARAKRAEEALDLALGQINSLVHQIDHLKDDLRSAQERAEDWKERAQAVPGSAETIGRIDALNEELAKAELKLAKLQLGSKLPKFKFDLKPGGFVRVFLDGLEVASGKPWIQNPGDQDYSALLVKLWNRPDLWEWDKAESSGIIKA